MYAFRDAIHTRFPLYTLNSGQKRFLNLIEISFFDFFFHSFEIASMCFQQLHLLFAVLLHSFHFLVNGKLYHSTNYAKCCVPVWEQKCLRFWVQWETNGCVTNLLSKQNKFSDIYSSFIRFGFSVANLSLFWLQLNSIAFSGICFIFIHKQVQIHLIWALGQFNWLISCFCLFRFYVMYVCCAKSTLWVIGERYEYVKCANRPEMWKIFRKYWNVEIICAFCRSFKT